MNGAQWRTTTVIGLLEPACSANAIIMVAIGIRRRLRLGACQSRLCT
jgi:hypothetical protein